MTLSTLANYFEAMTAAVFQSGLSARIVQAKWPGFESAFAGFDPRVVAELTPGDVDRLLADESIIRNRRKIEAMIANANRMLDLESKGGFADWLDSHEDEEDKAEAIRREFRFMGASGTHTFLRMVSFEDGVEAC